MKAAVIYENGGPDVLRYEDVPDPECPEGCALIDVEAISIEGGDLLARAASPLGITTTSRNPERLSCVVWMTVPTAPGSLRMRFTARRTPLRRARSTGHPSTAVYRWAGPLPRGVVPNLLPTRPLRRPDSALACVRGR